MTGQNDAMGVEKGQCVFVCACDALIKFNYITLTIYNEEKKDDAPQSLEPHK